MGRSQMTYREAVSRLAALGPGWHLLAEFSGGDPTVGQVLVTAMRHGLVGRRALGRDDRRRLAGTRYEWHAL